MGVSESIGGNQRFAANAFTTNGSSRERGFSITVWIDKRQGSASGTEFDEASLRRAVEQAEHLAKLSPVDVEYMPTLGPQKYKPVKGFVSKTAEISPTWRAKQIGAILDQCDEAKVVGAGLFTAGALHQRFGDTARQLRVRALQSREPFDDRAHAGRHEFRLRAAQPL